MAEIRILDDSTINQIAAGEVVERPVSVVKELVENAIDAKSTYISIEIKDGGIGMIRVSDNGAGISRDNVPKAFLRHATSKIKSVLDLAGVKSLGFRGEALSSIAAVAQVELLTKEKNDLFGTRYCISGGREMSLDDAGVPDGTTIIVKNLFFNTPARRKFLKSPLTEGGYVTELIERLVLSHPEIAFKYVINGREKITSSGSSDVMQNIYSIFGRHMAKLVVPISYEGDGFSISGYVGKPETARGNRNFEIFFANNRYVKSKMLSKACEEAYKPYLMLHSYPFAVIYLNIAPEDLDVNVHPSKTEIKFLKENEIYKALLECISEAASQRELIPSVTSREKEEAIRKHPEMYKPAEDISSVLPAQVKEDPELSAGHIGQIPADEPAADEPADVKPAADETVVVKPADIKPAAANAPEPFERRQIDEYKKIKAQELEEIKISDVSQESFLTSEFLEEAAVKDHKIIGQVFDTYWIVELNDKMYIIDQHAAHEKVLYERFKKQIDGNEVMSQNLSPALIVNLTAAEAETLSKYADNFAALGFNVEPFGGRDFAVTAVPTELFRMSARDYFTAVLDDLMENSRIASPAAVNDRIATMACKAAIKGNMRFTFEEAGALIDELLKLDNPYNCPHGRPTIISYSKSELEKLFKRIV